MISSCPSANTLRRYVPTILTHMEEESRELFGKAQPFSIIFDGTSRNGECLVIIYRVVDAVTLEIKQRLFCLRTEAQSLNSEALSTIIKEELQDQLNIRFATSGRLVCAIHDSAAVNKASIDKLVCLYI